MTLQEWFRRRGGTTNPYGRPVVLLPDTFNNHLHIDVGMACVEAIEAAGWQVIIPEGHVCCGRPLYDYGFLDTARRYLHGVLGDLREHIRAGTPVVGMEPSCVAVFKDELTKMLPHDNDAGAAGRERLPLPRVLLRLRHGAAQDGRHGAAVGPLSPPRHRRRGRGEAAHAADGSRSRASPGGCCGLAASWGFERSKYSISMDCGDQALLPAVRDADPQTQIVADGFSCKTQIKDAGTGRKALHVAQLMKLAREEGGAGASRKTRAKAERSVLSTPAPRLSRRAGRVAAVVAASTVAGSAAAGVRAVTHQD